MIRIGMSLDADSVGNIKMSLKVIPRPDELFNGVVQTVHNIRLLHVFHTSVKFSINRAIIKSIH